VKKERNDLKAGIFMLLSVAAIIGVIVGIKGVTRFLEPVQRRQVRFKFADDIGGLADGDDVRVGGAKVGTVRDISIRENETPPSILVTIAIPERFKLHQDAVINVQGTVTGSSWLNFESLGSPTSPMLAEGQLLDGQPGALAAIFAGAREVLPEVTGLVRDVRKTTLPKVNDTVDSFKATGDNATELIKYVKAKVDPIIDRYNKFADKGSSALDEIGSLFGDTKPDIRGTLKNLNETTASLKEKLPSILDRFHGTLGKVNDALDRANDALVDVKTTAENLREATGSARSILVTNRSKIDDMIKSLKTTGDNLKFASAEIRRSPWRLLYKPEKGEVANLVLYDAARQFAEGANNMQDSAVALRDALKDKDVDPKRVEKLLEQLDKNFTHFQQVEADLWKQVKQ
jgi:phospholipid/cholesterol/gamma-HCH transport system substrate-binding protein